MCLEKVGVGVDLLLGPPPHHRVIVLDVNVMHVQWRVPNGDVIMGDSPANILLDTVTLMQHGAQLCSVEIMPLTWMAAHRANPECGDSLIAALIQRSDLPLGPSHPGQIQRREWLQIFFMH